VHVRPAFAAVALSGLLGLSGCSSLVPDSTIALAVSPVWHAPLPHQGASGTLLRWWQQQGDPVLVDLIESAQAVSPTVAVALSRIEGARASQASANSALMPNISAQAGATRSVTQPNVPAATTVQSGLQASWEIDLVGANRAVSNAANAQVQGTQALWHDARVTVAAEVANLYYSLSSCRQQLGVAQRDAASRQETARLSGISAQAGFVAPGVAALARASAADSQGRLTQQAAQCEATIKGLVALTAVDEPQLRQKVAPALDKQAQAAPFSIASVPAKTITQRPDVFAAERDVVVAAATVGSATAQRFPRLSLNGSIGALRVSTAGTEQDVSTWSFGPLSLSLPIFDGGQRAAAVKSAQAAYQSAIVVYQGKVRQAVREVEEALLNLHSTGSREGDALIAAKGYAESLAATQSRFDQGLASLVELEDARRNALAADSAVLSLRLQRNLAWVSLYRAVGGGFEPNAPG
jgi:NodT family efflux transporter outer membrane factor (OMF) lipoprotein